MKKIFLILILGISLTGCAAIDHGKASFKACMEDKSEGGCHKKFDEAVKNGGTIGALVSAMAGPGAAAAGGLGGGGLSGLAIALYFGNKLLKKKREEDDGKITQ